ncbi:MAG: DUF1285 domain-containing protein, partial [Pseudomonadota bacterium]
ADRPSANAAYRRGRHKVSMVMGGPSDQDPHAPRAQSLPRLGLAEDLRTDRDLGLWIARDGRWYYLGSPIGRPELVKLFASALRLGADGYWLVTPVERGRIEVEDVPFVAVELDRDGQGTKQCLRMRTNLDEWVTLGAEHPITMRQPMGVVAESGPAPYVEVRDGLQARVARSVYYELVELAEQGTHEGRSCIGVWSGGRFFALDEPTSRECP